MAKKIKPFKCKFCDKIFNKYDQYAIHIETIHPDILPEDMTSEQFVYFLKTGKEHGTCVVCKKPTTWNSNTKKYKRFCDDPKCKEKYIDIFKSRMIGKYGKTTLLNDPEHQKKMLANRSISGTYNWSTGGESTYTGTYELSFLKFLDLIMDYRVDDILSPSPHTYYYIYEGIKKFYIPDIYIPSLNLEIEIKDGGDNANMHPKIQAVDKVKEKLKDDLFKSNKTGPNYLKIINKNNQKFFEYLEVAKYNYMNEINQSIIMM